MIEFVDLEHTPKNLLIRAVRRPQRDKQTAMERYRGFTERLGVEPSLERLLADMLRT